MEKVLIIGIGCAGRNIVNNIGGGSSGIETIVIDTHVSSFNRLKADKKIQIGEKLLKGLPAGGKPEVGEMAAKENLAEIKECIERADLIVLTCGMGGGTGSGAAPVIADLAKGMGIPVAAVVTVPNEFEGKRRQTVAEEAIPKLKANSDVLIVISEIASSKISIMDHFSLYDDICSGTIKSLICTLTGSEEWSKAHKKDAEVEL